MHKIRDFLLQKISTLKKPKTNLQIVQQNVLIKFQYLVHFLQAQAPQTAGEVSSFYIVTMRSVYLHQFKAYTTSLNKLQLDWNPGSSDLLVTPLEAQAAAESTPYKLAQMLGVTKFFEDIREKGNVFSLQGREGLLANLDADPIVAHSTNRQKFYPEALFRSHQVKLFYVFVVLWVFVVLIHFYQYSACCATPPEQNSSFWPDFSAHRRPPRSSPTYLVGFWASSRRACPILFPIVGIVWGYCCWAELWSI